MAYKVFSNGDALTGSELNTYLMNQSVMVFATASARDAALTTPSEGMVVWLQDSDKYVYYTGSAWADLISAAGSGNAIINGAFDIWQRGTSFTQTDFSAGRTHTADRYNTLYNAVPTAVTVSQQSFTPGAAPVAGYEGSFFYRSTLTTIGSTTIWGPQQRIEDVRTFAGQTATLSFWAKADSARNLTVEVVQNFGSGGSGDVTVTSTVQALTSSWARYTFTLTVPSISGKTVGASSSLRVTLLQAAASGSVLDIWGVQLESGSVATPFKRNGENIAAETAACQRYYYRPVGNIETTVSVSGSSVAVLIPLPVTMRAVPTSGHNITDGSYSTNPGANQWGLVQAQISWSTKSGTASSIALVGTQTSAFLQIGGATFSPTPNAIKINPDRYLELSAEL